MRYFLDTSAAVKYYHAEEGSETVASLFAAQGRKVLLSSLGHLELQSAFGVKVRSGKLSLSTAKLQRARFLLDVAAGVIEICNIDPDHFRLAEKLLGRYSFALRLRAMDSLQLAAAIDLAGRGESDIFVVADQTLADAARAEGLRVLNPEQHPAP